jgi:hypothetical protein
MVDPISAGGIRSVEQVSQTRETRQVITNETFETVRTKVSELDGQLNQVKEAGLVSSDQIKVASTEAKEMLNRYVNQGNEVGGLNSLFYDNRAKLENLRAELDRVGETGKSNEVTNYLGGLDKEFSSLQGILDNIDVNAPMNPLEMIKLQTKMEHITEHVEILSKVVEQVGSGIKTVLQTNL